MSLTHSLNNALFFIGSYSEKVDFIEEANGKGIISAFLDIQTGLISRAWISNEIFNATYLTTTKTGDFLFAAVDNFLLPGGVNVFDIKHDGKLTLLASQEVPGRATCHLTCHPDRKRVYVASYLNGVVTGHRFNGTSISPPVQTITYEGSGPNSERQQSAHAHQVTISPDEQLLYVCDLGSDRIWLHKLSDQADLLGEKTPVETPPGYGPRHLICHPEKPCVYVLCELNAHLLTYIRNEQTGRLELIDDKPTLPVKYENKRSASAIRLHSSKKSLMVSNRGHNSISVFSIDTVNGSLNLETWFSTEGEEPRDFAIDPTGNWLLAANQNSDTIVPFRLDPLNGLPTGDRASSFSCGTPVCLCFLT